VIKRIPGVRGAQAYLCRTGEGTAIIDPGYVGSHRAVLRFLQAQGERADSIDWVILTHHHIDHAASAFALCAATRARLAIHAADAAYLKIGRPRERMTLWGLPDRLPEGLARFVVSCASCEVTPLEDGQTIAGLRVIHAPGHTPGSICLWSAQESTLFAGDVINNERGIRTPPWTVNHSHRDARTAPRRLAGLRYQRACFGHGAEMMHGADQIVQAFLSKRQLAGEPSAAGSRLQP
jgi:glyoxylase-like metal-dependent hydrolase (beta-lactamase superfamily II)